MVSDARYKIASKAVELNNYKDDILEEYDTFYGMSLVESFEQVQNLPI